MARRFGVVCVASALVAVGLAMPTTVQARPLPAIATVRPAYVSPTVARRLRTQGTSPSTSVRVIVSFATNSGTTGSPTVAEVSAGRRSVLAGVPDSSYQIVSTFRSVPAVSMTIDSTALAALVENPLVTAVNDDQVITTDMTEANALTGVASVHTAGITGNGATVAIIDTGVDSTGGVVHSALADDLVGQRCFRTENDCIGGVTSAKDENGHGTHVAGIITGPQGVAPDARFYALKVFTTADTSDTNILNALDYVIGLNNTTPGTIDLVNMSLGGNNFSNQASCDAANSAYETAFASLNAQGVTVFVATGNDGQTTQISSPGCVTGAVGVGSVGDATATRNFSICTDNAQADKVSCFSNATPVQGAGELVDMLAPGCAITSTGLNGVSNLVECGTSMATPYAAGTAALLIQYLADHSLSMTPAQIEDRIESTGVPISDYRMAPGAPTFPRVSPPNMIGSFSLAAPTGFNITATTSNSVTTSWTASAGATEYRVYSSASGGPVVLAGTVTAPTTLFVDPAPNCGTLTYFVRSFNGSFESTNSNVDTDTSHACPPAPANDNFASAEVVTPDVAYTDTEPNGSYATEQAADPSYSCRFGGAAHGFQGVWYDITPTVATRVTVSTAATTLFDPAVGTPDTLVAIYTGTAGSFAEVVCNDDINAGINNLRSAVTSNLAAGTTYHVFVSQWDPVPAGSAGNLVTAFTWAPSTTATTTTTTTTTVSSTTTTTTTAPASTSEPATTAEAAPPTEPPTSPPITPLPTAPFDRQIPATGSGSTQPFVVVGFCMIAVGSMLVGRRRRAPRID
jgi:LPXTG-motif cell wall-anchored protein